MVQVDKNSDFAKFIKDAWERKQILKQFIQDKNKNLEKYKEIKAKLVKPL